MNSQFVVIYLPYRSQSLAFAHPGNRLRGTEAITITSFLMDRIHSRSYYSTQKIHPGAIAFVITMPSQHSFVSYVLEKIWMRLQERTILVTFTIFFSSISSLNAHRRVKKIVQRLCYFQIEVSNHVQDVSQLQM